MGWMTDAIRANEITHQPTGRLGTPTDTANLVRFLLSGSIDQRTTPLPRDGRYPHRPTPI